MRSVGEYTVSERLSCASCEHFKILVEAPKRTVCYGITTKEMYEYDTTGITLNGVAAHFRPAPTFLCNLYKPKE